MLKSRESLQAEAVKAAAVLWALAVEVLTLGVCVVGVGLAKGHLGVTLSLFVAFGLVTFRVAGAVVEDANARAVAASAAARAERGGSPRDEDEEPPLPRRPKAGEPRWPP